MRTTEDTEEIQSGTEKTKRIQSNSIQFQQNETNIMK